jgi:hypothetical protein
MKYSHSKISRHKRTVRELKIDFSFDVNPPEKNLF